MTFGVTILAGGRSSRMGRDKSRLTWRGRTVIRCLRDQLAKLDHANHVRVIRHDRIPHCGPLSGIYTALLTTHSDAELILACDMPLVSISLLQRLVQRLGPRQDAVFVHQNGLAGFPCVLRPQAMDTVKRLIDAGEFSLQLLCRTLKAAKVQPTRAEAESLLNVNTPEDWARAKERMETLRAARQSG